MYECFFLHKVYYFSLHYSYFSRNMHNVHSSD